MHNQDTIIALATPPGPSALAIIRLSGPKAIETINSLLSKSINEASICYRVIYDSKRERLDDVVITTWNNPQSYTGEDLIEISCHGNMLIADSIIKTLIQQGYPNLRAARPGEFTERAFLNGKIDLTQAEAVMDLVHSKSERSLKAAQQLQAGQLGQQITELQEKLLHLLAHLEAYIDFPEEDIEPEIGEGFIEKIRELIDADKRLLSYAKEGRRLREGVKVTIAGAPNAGKSSLLNALIQKDRAIVSSTPGTTRDTIEEGLILHGIYIRLIDTAGIRSNEQADEIEQLGISRSLKALEQADLILSLIDSSDPEAQNPLEVQSFEKSTPIIICLTKTDLPRRSNHQGLEISTHDLASLELLKKEVTKKLGLHEERSDSDMVAINNRHETQLLAAKESLERALEASQQNAPPELVSSDLRLAMDAWGEIIGKRTNEDILDKLFASFCIGK
ncbi:MAG: tRNA uridine-5-carboxymethylaminomethyl(34) synthesis GTPase MnmE [Verrucomicrobiota bacterium]